MNKKKIIFINLIFILVLFTIIETVSYNILVNRYKDCIEAFNNIEGNPAIKIGMKYEKVTLPNKKDLNSDFRPIENRDTNKKPIILFGCSFTEGFGLNEDETFSRKLADYTNRTVINRGKSGTGIPFLYYQLSDKEIVNSLPKNAEYIIFTLIPDHFPRLFRYRNFVLTGDHTLRYKIKDNKLVEDRPIFPAIHSLFTSILIEEYIANKKSENKQEKEKLFYKLFEDSYKIIQKEFPDTKLIILYIKNPQDNDTHEYDEIINSLKNLGNNVDIIYINDFIPDIYEEKYWLEDRDHPSAAAWDKIIPILTNKFNIN